MNAADGVNIHAEGESRLLDEFVIELSENAPAAAQVKEIELKEVPLQDFDSFEIRFSDDAAVQETTLVSADLARATTARRNCSTRTTAASATLSSTVPIAGLALPSSMRCPTIARARL